VLDDSERTKDVVRIAARSVVKAILRRPMQKAVYEPCGQARSSGWRHVRTTSRRNGERRDEQCERALHRVRPKRKKRCGGT